jgi:Ulp1 family protease
MIKLILCSGLMHGKKGSKVSEESAIVIRGITTTQENIREIKYTLSERACRSLYERKWITDEVINSYMSLISTKRSKNAYNEAHFHLFDSLFFFKLNHL